jgi:hypothetical protein
VANASQTEPKSIDAMLRSKPPAAWADGKTAFEAGVIGRIGIAERMGGDAMTIA